MATAATADAIPQDAAKTPKKKKGSKFLLILFCLLAMGLLRVGFIFFLIGMMPTIVVSYFDKSPQRYLYKTVLFCNLSAMLPSLGKMVALGPKSSVIQDVMGSGMNWVIIYMSALGGVFLVKTMPVMAQFIVGGFHQARVTQLQGTQQKIEVEWGQEVTQFSKTEEATR